MSNEPTDEAEKTLDEETALRGAALGSPLSAVDHLARARKRNPDRELRLDGEEDTLYNDGLDIQTDGEPLAGTDGNGPKGIKG